MREISDDNGEGWSKLVRHRAADDVQFFVRGFLFISCENVLTQNVLWYCQVYCRILCLRRVPRFDGPFD